MIKKKLALITAFLLIGSALTPLESANLATKDFSYTKLKTGEYAPQELIIKFNTGTTNAQQLEILSQLSHTKLTALSRGRSFRLLLADDQNLVETIESLNNNNLVTYAEPNYLVKAFAVPNDPYYVYQWNFQQIKIPEAWSSAVGQDVIVAVVDTGVAYENYWPYSQAPDLKGTQFVSGYDFVDNDAHPNDANGHGTHIAGTIAQTTNNSLGTAGIAYRAKIMPIRVLGKDGSGTYADTAEGIIWAVDHGAKVINLSLGGAYPGQVMADAIAYARSHKVLVVAAVGNSGLGSVAYPAAYENGVIAVGAVRFDKNLAYYSNWGAETDLVAPGGDLKVDQNADNYGDGILQQTFVNSSSFFSYNQSFSYYFFQGTSMAAAHVSGVAALLASAGADDPDLIRDVLYLTAEDLGASGRDSIFGNGLINATAALQTLQNNTPLLPETQVNQVPQAKISGPTSGETGQELMFNAINSTDSDGQVVSWQWSFGDGQSDSGQSVKHVYNQPGEYILMLTVLDDRDGQGQATQKIIITAPQVEENILSLQVGLNNLQGTASDNFKLGERVYVTINAFLNGQSLKSGRLEINIYDPDNVRIYSRNSSTNLSGQYKFSYRPVKTGQYSLKVKLTYQNFSPLTVLRSFNINK